MALTRQRNLRTGMTVWDFYKKPVISGSRLRRSTRAEVVIVGAGISGALIAHALTEAGFRPLIVDRRRRALLGSTVASTALLQFELDTPLTALGASIGCTRASNGLACLRARAQSMIFEPRLLGWALTRI